MPEPRTTALTGNGSGGAGRPGLAGLLRGATERVVLEDGPGHRRARPGRAARIVPEAHGRAARGVLGRRRGARRGTGHPPVPGAVAVDGRGGGGDRLGAPGAAAGGGGLAAARRGGAGRG